MPALRRVVFLSSVDTKLKHKYKMAKLLLLVVGIAALAMAHGASTSQLQRLIAEEQSKCVSGQDSMACIKERAMRFVDNVMSKDSYTVRVKSSTGHF